jgi:dsRNA-specific ribonuclease
MDKFLEWLENNKKHYALKDSSYKKVLQSEERLADTKDIKVNTELATYGDAVLKLAICSILWREDISKLSEIKKKYEEDESLVKIIAQYYRLLDYMLYDKEDKPNDYNYEKKSKTKNNGDEVVSKNNNKHKFIATAVEACLGAIYLENNSIDLVLEIVNAWKNLIDNSDNN